MADLDVSVIVPVYNPGKFIEDCIDGILTQTMDTSRFEVIFVDDGSTDETPARLDELAADHRNIRVFHEPGSGWSGRPRNVGIDNAVGRYVFFCDHDDWLGPEALDRMIAYADENHSDVLLPKMVGHKRGVPSVLYAMNRPDVTPWTAPLTSSFTPHKVFRRAFLNDHKLRFPEGRRRLEDHVFVMEALFLAAHISVLSDYPCYHHISRDDAANAGLEHVDPVSYYGYVREVLDIIDRYVEPGPKRDAVRSRTFTHEILGRLRRPRSFDDQSQDYRDLIFAEVRKIVSERYEPGYEARFALATRERALAVRENKPEVVHEINAKAKLIGIKPRLTSLDWNGSAWVASLEAAPVVGGKPVRFVPQDSGEWSVDPRLLPESRIGEIAVTTKELIGGRVWVNITDRQSDLEWYVPCKMAASLRPLGDDDGANEVVLTGTATFDPSTLGGGTDLTAGLWDVTLRYGMLGMDMRAKVVGDAAAIVTARPAVFGSRPSVAILYLTDKKNTFAIDVGQRKTTLIAAAVKRGLGPVSITADGASIGVPVEISPGAAPREVVVVLSAGGTSATEFKTTLVGSSDGARLEFGHAAHQRLRRRWVLRRQGYTLALRPKAKADPIKIGVATLDGDGSIATIELAAPKGSRRN